MAPEMKDHQHYDTRVDVWSMGRTLFSLWVFAIVTV